MVADLRANDVAPRKVRYDPAAGRGDASVFREKSVLVLLACIIVGVAGILLNQTFFQGHANEPTPSSVLLTSLPLIGLVVILGSICVFVFTTKLRSESLLLEHRIQERTSNLESEIGRRAAAENELRVLVDDLKLRGSALDAAANGIVITDDHAKILWVNQAFARMTGYLPSEALGQSTGILRSGENPDEFYEDMWKVIRSGNVWTGSLVNRRKDGTTYDEEMTITPILNDDGEIHRYIAVKLDVTDRRLAETERKTLEVQLEQAQKLEVIGQLAAGIAHEINTPTQYVGDNTRFLEESFGEIVPLLKRAEELVIAADRGTEGNTEQVRLMQELALKLKSELAEADVEYLADEIPRAIEQSLGGIDRVRKIVQSMKEFSHPGVEGMTSIDLNKSIESTITVASNEWKYVAEIVTEFDANLLPVPCLPGEINQVVLNMIVNASHAIADVVGDGSGEKGTITIRTSMDDEFVEIQITDTGSGIPETARGKIFQPFFTTKEVGKGTGQGLSIAHGVVTKKHGGTLRFESKIGSGTTFFIRLPLEQASTDVEGVAA